MSRLINDVTAIRMLLGVGILNLVNTPIYYAYGVAIMLTLDPRLTVVALLPYPLLLLVGEAHQPPAHGADAARPGGARRAEQRRAGEHQRHPRRQGLRRRGGRAAAFARSTTSSPRQSLRAGARARPLMPLMKIAAGVGTLMVLWYGGVEVIGGRLEPRRPGRLHRLPEPARLADDGDGLDAVDPAARARRDAAARAHLRHRAGDPRCARRRAAAGRARAHRVPQRRLRLPAAPTTATRSLHRRLVHASSRDRSWRSSGAPAPARARSCSSCRACSTSAAGAVLLDGRDVRDAAARAAAPRDRLRAAGSVPLLDHHPRQHRLRRRRRRRRRGRAAPPRSPASPTTSTPSRTATTPSSASAASRCPAARSSA